MAFISSATCPDSSFFLEYKDENGLRKSCMAASHQVGDATATATTAGLSSESGPSNHHIPYAVLHGMNVPSTSFLNQEGSAFNFGELEEAIARQVRNDEAQAPLFTAGGEGAGRPAATLEMFPAWPMRFHQTSRGSSKSGGEESTDSESQVNTLTTTTTNQLELEPESPMSKNPSSSQAAFDQKHLHFQQQQQQLQQKLAISDTSRGPNAQTQSAPKPSQEKTLRRLAQNREAARKSRLRKKAYVQQLESSRIKLTQLEQELHRARAQGLFLAGAGGGLGNISSGAAIFDMEYARWLEDDHRHMSEFRTGLQAHLSDRDLLLSVDGYISHYDELFQLKGVAAKSDVFHLITGMWTTPAERCFLWMGGFRPSELIKMLIGQLDPLTEQQFMGIYNLQQSSQQAEEALTQGLEQLHQSLVDTIASGPVIDGMQQMAVALGKLTNLEGFVRQADNLRQQTLHQLRRILTVRQAARCFLVIGEYYGRLRALSSLWASRPREKYIPNSSINSWKLNHCENSTHLHSFILN
ncbi:transcription factor TGA2-like [Pyrus ussuriensis x Pyrus communis]|uniref:Transcription factor TGA2-like n=1 Tax=Pyrus ussuriensis x Pyrus communis TaxID=2448454 RepID=A0A5N5FTR5_9ROSA|nr:transcription factor TGA2-like [Pyrus ussuriensis x Pyrus communis]